MNRHRPRCIHKYGWMDDKYGKDILILVGMISFWTFDSDIYEEDVRLKMGYGIGRCWREVLNIFKNRILMAIWFTTSRFYRCLSICACL